MTRKNNLKVINWLVSFGAVMAIALVATTPAAQAADGDVSFMIEDQNIFTIPSGFSNGAGTNTSLDVFLQVEGGGDVLAGGFGISLNVTGPITFNIGPITVDPNLSAASEDSFVFDTASLSGVAYGNHPAGDSSLGAVAIATGVDLNVSVPHGAGLFGAPINIPDGTSGVHTVTFGSNPNVDSLVFVGVDASGDAFLPIGTSNDAILTIVPTVTGDHDLNGVVGLGDFNIWFNNFGTTNAIFTQGENDGNGVVGLGDFNNWFNSFGDMPTIPGPSPAASAVPEPSTLLLLVLAAPLALLRRRRR